MCLNTHCRVYVHTVIRFLRKSAYYLKSPDMLRSDLNENKLLSYYRQYINLLKLLQDLYSLHFRVISQEVNMIMGPDNHGFYNLLEVVFMKEQKQ